MKVAYCKYCGKQFSTRNLKQKYCSKACSNQGRNSIPCSEETKKKISESAKKTFQNGRTIYNKGKSPSIETKLKMKKAWENRKLKPVSKETRERMRKSHLGEKHYAWKGGIKAKKERRKQNVEYRLYVRIGCLIRNNLRKNSKHGISWQELLGYTNKQLKYHLETTMPEGYKRRETGA